MRARNAFARPNAGGPRRPSTRPRSDSGTFENAAVGIIHCDTEGRFLRVNQRYCDIVGFSREELLGMDIKDVTYPEDMALTHDKFTALVRGDLTCYSEDKRDIRKDGAVIWINIYVSLQRNQLGAHITHHWHRAGHFQSKATGGGAA